MAKENAAIKPMTINLDILILLSTDLLNYIFLVGVFVGYPVVVEPMMIPAVGNDAFVQKFVATLAVSISVTSAAVSISITAVATMTVAAMRMGDP